MSRTTYDMNRWVWPVTQENWEVVKNYSVWAVNAEHKTKRIKNNDFILFYVKGTGLFRGIFQVAGSWYKSEKIIWSEEIESKKKIYHYECKLKPFLIKDVIFKNIRERLEFTKPYVANPNIVLMATGNGPANFTRSISKDDLDAISSHMTSVIKPEKVETDSNHQETIERLREIGDALGFETHTEQEYTLVSPGSIVDMIWETRIGSMGAIKYSFEVQSKGSIKSLITNLIQSMNDPAIKKVVAVSDTKQLEQIRKIVENTDAYTTVAKSMFVFLDIQMVREFFTLLPQLNKFKQMLSV